MADPMVSSSEAEPDITLSASDTLMPVLSVVEAVVVAINGARGDNNSLMTKCGWVGGHYSGGCDYCVAPASLLMLLLKWTTLFTRNNV